MSLDDEVTDGAQNIEIVDGPAPETPAIIASLDAAPAAVEPTAPISVAEPAPVPPAAATVPSTQPSVPAEIEQWVDAKIEAAISEFASLLMTAEHDVDGVFAEVRAEFRKLLTKVGILKA